MEIVPACVQNAQYVFAISELQQEEILHEIDTGVIPNTRQASQRISFSLNSKIEKMVDDTLKVEVIVESGSPWVSPVVLVK